jgi:predicted DNA-binding antitoxin AbrB/MazE fold protein
MARKSLNLGDQRILVIQPLLAFPNGSRYRSSMTTTMEAIYENGKLLLAKPLLLPEKSHVQVTIESPPSAGASLPTEDLLDLERRNRIWGNLDDAEGW